MEYFDNCGGVCNPDLDNKKTWRTYIEVEDEKTEVWCQVNEEWETDSDSSDDGEMDKMEERAKESVVLRKAAFDQHERKIRKENPDIPLWGTRMWFYMSILDDTREKEILGIEKDAREKAKAKKRKKGRDKLFKRLNSKRRRF